MYAYADKKQAASDKKKTDAPKIPSQERTTAPNVTGIPDTMKTRFESLSGFSFDDVRVHYNSDKPAQLQALAYTQGNQVYVAPGQERHLGHELGHVVQQKRGTVRATGEKFGKKMNDDNMLESEADTFGAFLSTGNQSSSNNSASNSDGVVQCVSAYRVEKDSNRKVDIDNNGNVMLNMGTHGIDISFENDNHARYYYDEHKSEDVTTVIKQWDMSDNWWGAAFSKSQGNTSLKAPYANMNKLQKPSASDGKDVAKKDRTKALHFNAAWGVSLNSATKGNGCIIEPDINEEGYTFEDSKESIYTWVATKRRDAPNWLLWIPENEADDILKGTPDGKSFSSAKAFVDSLQDDEG